MVDKIEMAAFEIEVDGNKISDDIRVKGFRTWHALNRIGWAEIYIADSNNKEKPFPASNNTSLVPGKSLEILIARGNIKVKKTIFKGSITATHLNFKMGRNHLVIEGRDDAYKMTLVPTTTVFTELTDSKIANNITNNYDGLTPSFVETTTEYPRVLQYQTTDWDFLLTRLMVQSQLVSSFGGTIKTIKGDGSSGNKIKQTIDNSLIRFDASLDSRDQIKSYDIISWDIENQEPVTSSSKNPKFKNQGSLKADQLVKAPSLKMAKVTLNSAGTVQSDTAAAVASALLLQSRLAKIRCEVEIIGRSDIMPGDYFEFSGYGKLFDGEALISEVEHFLDSGHWKTTVRTGLDRKWLMDNLVDKGGADRFPERLLGQLHLGKVIKISDDPKEMARVQVSVPLIFGVGAKPVWARVTSFSAGKERGAFFMPNVGDEVLVGFIGANNQNPVIFGKFFSQERESPITPADENNYIKGFYSDKKMKLEFDDEKPSISLTTPGGANITLDDDAGSLSLNDQNGNSLTLDSGGITVKCSGNYSLTASTGSISESAQSLDFSADMAFSASGNSGAELTSSAITTVKGSMVQIN